MMPNPDTQSNELFELCKETYEKTGWNAELATHFTDGEEGVSYGVPRKALPGGVEIPLYTSDCLLEKLPRTIEHDDHVDYLTVWANDDEDWIATYELSNDCHRYDMDAGTPLFALLKLTLALHEAGELK